jgi:glycosyltransferase involved in cell wall biosynthesis
MCVQDETDPIEFVVLVPSYNNEKWCVQNLESIVNQTYPHWSLYYINDCSTDHTREIVDAFVKSHAIEHKCKIINNSTRKFGMANIYEAIHLIDPTKVIVLCDGDDWLADETVLEKLAEIYLDEKIWMTYGNYKTWPEDHGSCCAPIPEDVRINRAFRRYPWVASHLKTFYAKLFHLIKKEDFLWKQGMLFPVTYDLAIMFPMLEMASEDHFQFIPEVLYIYNIRNPLNVIKTNPRLQVELEYYIRSRQAYEPLKTLF